MQCICCEPKKNVAIFIIQITLIHQVSVLLVFTTQWHSFYISHFTLLVSLSLYYLVKLEKSSYVGESQYHAPIKIKPRCLSYHMLHNSADLL